MKHVIVGGGPAGVTAAETLRKIEATADITLIGGESGPPYCRMAIPYYLAGDIAEQGTYFRHSGDHYARLGIRYLNDRVETISATDGRIRLAGGADLAYDRLLLATGSRPAMLPVPGLDTPGVYSCWTLDDARHIAARATAGAEVVLIGAASRLHLMQALGIAA